MWRTSILSKSELSAFNRTSRSLVLRTLGTDKPSVSECAPVGGPIGHLRYALAQLHFDSRRTSAAAHSACGHRHMPDTSR